MRTLVGHRLAVETAAFSRDGRRLVTAGQDARIIVWDLDTGLELLSFPFQGNLPEVAFSDDHQRLMILSDWKVTIRATQPLAPGP